MQVVAIKHARRKQDGAKYPSLESFNQMYNCHGEVAAYLQAEPVEALQYILDDFLLAFNIVDKTADGLALLVSAICQAAAQELPGMLLLICQGFAAPAGISLADVERADSCKTANICFCHTTSSSLTTLCCSSMILAKPRLEAYKYAYLGQGREIAPRALGPLREAACFLMPNVKHAYTRVASPQKG